MNFEVDRYSSAWAHIALCADLTWAKEPPDEFVLANQRLWAQHCRVTQVLQDGSLEQLSLQTNSQCELSDNRLVSYQNQENGASSVRKSVKDVIPESRLAQFYGNFYYDEVRERCYTSANEKSTGRGYNGHCVENPDLMECWMLPEVDYWFRKLLEDPADRNLPPRRRRYYKMLPEDDFEINDHRSAASERCRPGRARAAAEAALAARVQSVRALWARPRPPSPPAPRKIRARRRQPRRLANVSPTYSLDVPTQLLCDPSRKFQFDSQKLSDCQRAMGRLTASVQAVMRATAARCPPYRGTNVTRYAPTMHRPARCPDRRYGIWWPRNHPSPRLEKIELSDFQNYASTSIQKTEKENVKKEEKAQVEETNRVTRTEPITELVISEEIQESEKETLTPKEKVIVDGQMPSTSAAIHDTGLRKKRLYSTVLSMSAPPPINLNQIRLTQKLVTPGILKLNPKIVLPAARIRAPNVDNKFEELEKEALEQYKASDESIDTKFRELEKEAVEQYTTSNSNTSCSSGNSAEKKASSSPLAPLIDLNKKQSQNFHKEKPVDSVVIYSQNFPDLNTKSQTPSTVSLKNSNVPLRGGKKEQLHRSGKSLRSLKGEPQRPASDTDYEVRELNFKGHKGSARWSLHAVPPKKRHLTFCVSDISSDEEIEDPSGAIKDASPCIRNHVTGKVKMSAHGGGDLHPIMRKT